MGGLWTDLGTWPRKQNSTAVFVAPNCGGPPATGGQDSVGVVSALPVAVTHRAPRQFHFPSQSVQRLQNAAYTPATLK